MEWSVTPHVCLKSRCGYLGFFEEPPEAAPLTVAESRESPETGAATADAPLSAVVDEGERGFGG